MQFTLFKASAVAAAVLGLGAFNLSTPSASAFSLSGEYSFAGQPDGAVPLAGLVADSSGNLYGSTGLGGANNAGCIYKLTPNGSGGYIEGVLYSFTAGTDGAEPAPNALALHGSILYGTTFDGGSSNAGVLFSYDISTGVLKPLHEFTALKDGGEPDGSVAYDSGVLYGTAYKGGTDGYGVVYKINAGGSGFKVLHSFTGGADGDDPYCAPIKIGSLFYGVTSGDGGSGSYGTVYYINNTGTTYGVMHNFVLTDGQEPSAGRLIAIGTTIYGTSRAGGASGYGVAFSITTGSYFVDLYNFTGGADGSGPYNTLVNAGNGYIFGTTYGGGNNGLGAIFRIKISTGHLNTPYSFTGGSDGSNPNAGSLYKSGSDIFGTNYSGGSGAGTVYRFTP